MTPKLNNFDKNKMYHHTKCLKCSWAMIVQELAKINFTRVILISKLYYLAYLNHNLILETFFQSR